MTMVPAENLSKQHHQRRLYYYGIGCGGSFTNTESFCLMKQGYEYKSDNDDNNNVNNTGEACLESSDLVLISNQMAEDESRTNSFNEAASSSKDHNNNKNSNNNQEEIRDDSSWLQLSIGGGGLATTRSQDNNNKHDHDHVHQVDPTVRRGGLIELDLLQDGSNNNSQRPLLAPIVNVPDQYRAAPLSRPVMNIASGNSFSNSSLFFQGSSSLTTTFNPPPPPLPSIHLHHQEINWAFRPMTNIAMAATASPSSSSSSSSSSLMPYFGRPFQIHTGIDVAGPSLDYMRLIDPPRRPHSGVWFTLQASQNQAKEPFLPQIPKSFLRIKDGKMTVRLLMKYLVNKLKLDSESEIEITCRGQQLLPFLTLQHVRDNIWSPRDPVTLLQDSSTTTDHLMVLHYGRSA